MSFKYKIMQQIAVLSESQNESKQVNIISYNDAKPKVDIRNWLNDGKLGKGITLNDEEWAALGKCFSESAKNTDCIKVLDEICWLIRKNTAEYEIDPEEFGVTVGWESELILSSDKKSANYSICFEIDKAKLQKNIEFLNDVNKYFSENYIFANAYIDFKGENEYIKIVGIMPFHLEIEGLVDALEEFLSEYADAINEIGTLSIKQLYIDNVIVIGDLYSCMHDNHKSEEVLISVDFVEKDGSITRVETKAFYCDKCNLYFVRKYDYQSMKHKAGNAKMLCQEIVQERYYKNPVFSEFNLNDHSILNAYGYNVNSIENLSNIQRQGILSGLIDRGILSKNRIASYLAHFIKLNSNKKKDMQSAIQKWNNDRTFVLDYQVNNRKKVLPSKIKLVKYIPTR